MEFDVPTKEPKICRNHSGPLLRKLWGALSPMESCKVRIQTSPIGTFPTTLREAAPKIYAAEGLNGFYKSLVPLWGRQIPYTMMKFACFERTVEALYAYVVPKPRAECSKG